MSLNVIDFAALERLVVSPPFHRWLGVRLVALDEESVEIALPWREEFVSHPKIRYTHGGVIAALVDLAADYAIAARLGRGVPTIDMRVDFHSAAREGEELVARATVIKLGRSVATAEARILGPDGRLIASGRGVYSTAERG
jgi:uncharacterized protein (TIGR00369 family)